MTQSHIPPGVSSTAFGKPKAKLKSKMKSKDTGISISTIILLLGLLLIIGLIIWAYVLSQRNPTINDKHTTNCIALSKTFDDMGLPVDSPIRYKMCDRQFECAMEYRPKETEPKCPPGRVLNGGSRFGGQPDPTLGPCCTLPPYSPCGSGGGSGNGSGNGSGDGSGDDSTDCLKMDIMAEIQNHPLLASASALFVGVKVLRALKTALSLVSRGLKGSKKAGEKLVEALAAKLAERGGAEAGAKLADKVVDETSKGILKKIAEGMGEKFGEMGGNLSMPIVGEIIDILMMIGMIIDFKDTGGFRQFIATKEFLDTRDALEGGKIEQMKDMGREPPFHFTMGMLKLSYDAITEDMDAKDHKDGQIIDKLYVAFTQSVTCHMEDAFKAGQQKLTKADDNALDEWMASIVSSIKSQDDDTPYPEPPDSLSEVLTKAFSEDPKTRANETWEYMQSHCRETTGLIDYVHFDPDIADDHNYGITLSYPLGYNMWNNFVRSGRGASLPMAVYSEYYRGLKKSTTAAPNPRPGLDPDPTSNDRRHADRSPSESFISDHAELIAGGIGAAVGAGMGPAGAVAGAAMGAEAASELQSLGSTDRREEQVYTLETKKYLGPDGKPKKIMQINWAKTALDTYCRRGFHMPSTGDLLSTVADKTACTHSGGDWTNGSCSDSEYMMNKLDCLSQGYDWTPSQCVGGHGGPGIIEGMISTYTDTIHHVAVGSGPGSDVIKGKDFKGDVSTAMGKGSIDANNSDEFPEDYGVVYDDDTGICNFMNPIIDTIYKKPSGINQLGTHVVDTWEGGNWHPSSGDRGSSKWCERMGLDTHVLTDPSLYHDQTYVDCDTGLAQDVLEGLFGQNTYRAVKNAIRDIRDGSIKAEVAVGGFLEENAGAWADKAGGGINDSGSIAYAMDGHMGERIGHDIGLEGVGKGLDDLVHSPAGYLIPGYGQYRLLTDLF